MTRRLLAVDIDNTLADYTSALRDVAAAYGGYACPDPTEYDFSLAPDWPFSVFWFNCFLWFWSGSFFGFGRGAC
jgi:hypothetical protein